jgi:hypothetical protein
MVVESTQAMKTRVLTLVVLSLALLLSTHFALKFKEVDPKGADNNLLELELPREIGNFLKGNIRPIALSLRSENFSIDLGVQQNGWWWIFKPERTMANQIWVHQWIASLTRASLLRTLGPEEWDPVGVEDSFDVKLYGSGNEMISFQVLRLKSAPEYLYFQLEDGSAIKAECSVPPILPKSMDEVRTQRIWPFEMPAITSLTYSRGAQTRKWSLVNEKWTTDRLAETKFWQNFFKKWGQWGSTSFLEKHTPSAAAIASWKIEFISGEKSLLELFRDPIHGWVVQYRGRSIAQVIDESTRQTCFPEGDF